MREVLRRWLLRKADAVQVPGESGARYVRRFGVTDNKIVRVANATDLSLLRPPRITREPGQVRRLLYVGRLVELKGLVPFLKVLVHWSEQHPEREIELWFAGGGPVQPVLESMEIASVSLKFLGTVPYQQVPDIYACADVLIFPTLADEWGLVVNEAMAAGVPVLGSLYSQAVEELVEDGVNGWTFHPDRPTEMFAALDRALQISPHALQAFREAATSKALELSPDKVAERYLKTISFVMSSSSHT
jgi:glycosyltransferase involved in cell wall biosynthesis